MARESNSPNFSFRFENRELPPRAPARTPSNNTGGLSLGSPCDLLPDNSPPTQPARQMGQHLAEGLPAVCHQPPLWLTPAVLPPPLTPPPVGLGALHLCPRVPVPCQPWGCF